MKKTLFAVLAPALMFLGCATSGSYGRFVQDGRVQTAFEGLRVPKNYSYYYNGPRSYPTAIIGVAKDFTVQSPFWHFVQLSDEEMGRWLESIRTDWFSSGGFNREGYANNGWRLLAPDGREAGIMFSKYKRVVATFSDDAVIGLSVPQPSVGSFRWRDE